jgi:glycosyltransferase involved in cell wall biosynthesis
MEKYLKRCLDSVLISSILDKIEIIIVNDGSTDGSLAIMESYKAQFPQSIVVINKSNGKAGSCRNAALKIAHGKYFKILDADDWFDSDAFVKYIEILEKINVDMVLTNYSKEFASGGSITAFSKNDIKKIIHGNEYDFSKFDLDNYLLVMHSITYRTELLTHIRFQCTEGTNYTDTEYCFYPLPHIKSYIYLDIILYKYYIGRDGQSVSETSVAKNRNDIYLLISKMAVSLKQSGSTGKIKENQLLFLERVCISYYIAILILSAKNNDDEIKLRHIDDLIKSLDDALYTRMERYRCCRIIKFVKVWRNKNQYCHDLVVYKILSSIRRVIKWALSLNAKKHNVYENIV